MPHKVNATFQAKPIFAKNTSNSVFHQKSLGAIDISTLNIYPKIKPITHKIPVAPNCQPTHQYKTSSPITRAKLTINRKQVINPIVL